MTLVPYHPGRKVDRDGLWWFDYTDELGARIAIMHGTCPHAFTLKNHRVAADGVVSPSVVCPYAPCGFHEFVMLVGW